ncbi:excisionase family DNA-binding protein [Pseudonocardia nigra]|uniref:excisionase family DNA-binding protein n=1 Tax=Pseudonocardia nigra TaxID=1921578 RepID=UPI001C5DF895|nr:excisionase family DNA-binding protein [Pseudonocardia nigra]
MTDPRLLLVQIDEPLRRYLLTALVAGRRELRRNGVHPPVGFDRLTAALAARTGQGQPEFGDGAADVEAALMDYDTAAARLAVSPRTVRRLVASGRLEAVPIGRRRLIRACDVDLMAGARRAG